MLASVLCDYAMQVEHQQPECVSKQKFTCQCRFNRVRYTIQAVHTMSTDRSLAPIADTVQQVEAKLLRKKTELRQFESEYRQVSSARHETVRHLYSGHVMLHWNWTGEVDKLEQLCVLDCLLILMHACIGVNQTINGITSVLTAEMHVCTVQRCKHTQKLNFDNHQMLPLSIVCHVECCVDHNR